MNVVKEMNEVAQRVAERDNAPFFKALDTSVLLGANSQKPQYEDQRTGACGIADKYEFVEAFDPDYSTFDSSISSLAIKLLHLEGHYDFLTIKRTPTLFIPGQRGSRLETYSYIGNVWVTEQQPAIEQLAHRSVLSVVRAVQLQNLQLG